MRFPADMAETAYNGEDYLMLGRDAEDEPLKIKLKDAIGHLFIDYIKPTDAAPTPARNGNYTFSIGGAKPAWLTAEAGITTVKALDGVAVVYTAPSAYSYTHVDTGSSIEQARSQSTSKVPSSKLVDDELNKIDIYNVTVKVPLPAGQFYTSEAARAAVPVSVRKSGLKINYATAERVWMEDTYTPLDLGGWLLPQNWYVKKLDSSDSFVDFQSVNYSSLNNRLTAFENSIVNGKRLLNLRWEQGKLDNGVDDNTYLSGIKNAGYIPIIVGSIVNITIVNGYQFRIVYFDANKVFVANETYYGVNKDLTINYPFIRVFIIKSDFSTLKITDADKINITSAFEYSTQKNVENAKKNRDGKVYSSLTERINDIESAESLSDGAIKPRKVSFINEVYELIDQTSLTIGAITKAGSINTAISSVKYTPFIKVNPNTEYRYSYLNTSNYIAFYDEDKNIILTGGYVRYDEQKNVGQFGILITGANTFYIRATTHGLLTENSTIKSTAKTTNMVDVYLDDKYLYGGSGETVCIGDSLTYGSGSTGNAGYPAILATLTGMTCNKLGFPGDTSKEIVGYTTTKAPIMVKAGITIPVSGSVTVELTDYSGADVSIAYQSIAAPNLNPVTICGVVGNLTLALPGHDASLSNDYVFTRSTTGQEVNVHYPTPLVTNCSVKHNRDTAIICIGQNGGWGSIAEYINQVNFIIANQQNVVKKYIVVGIPAQSFANLGSLETALNLEYGRHFINMRDYLCVRGLADSNITPTSQDLADIAIGKPPTSLRVDTVHLNDAGYIVMATQIYKRGIELGYWT